MSPPDALTDVLTPPEPVLRPNVPVEAPECSRLQGAVNGNDPLPHALLLLLQRVVGFLSLLLDPGHHPGDKEYGGQGNQGVRC